MVSIGGELYYDLRSLQLLNDLFRNTKMSPTDFFLLQKLLRNGISFNIAGSDINLFVSAQFSRYSWKVLVFTKDLK